jgi:hypothetical protein
VPGDRDHAGERTYALRVPAGQRPRLDLRSHGKKLSVAALGGVPCFSTENTPSFCQMLIEDGLQEQIYLPPDKVEEWWIVIEGEDGIEGSFDLDVSCEPFP